VVSIGHFYGINSPSIIKIEKMQIIIPSKYSQSNRLIETCPYMEKNEYIGTGFAFWKQSIHFKGGYFYHGA